MMLLCFFLVVSLLDILLVVLVVLLLVSLLGVLGFQYLFGYLKLNSDQKRI